MKNKYAKKYTASRGLYNMTTVNSTNLSCHPVGLAFNRNMTTVNTPNNKGHPVGHGLKINPFRKTTQIELPNLIK